MGWQMTDFSKLDETAKLRQEMRSLEHALKTGYSEVIQMDLDTRKILEARVKELRELLEKRH